MNTTVMRRGRGEHSRCIRETTTPQPLSPFHTQECSERVRLHGSPLRVLACYKKKGNPFSVFRVEQSVHRRVRVHPQHIVPQLVVPSPMDSQLRTRFAQSSELCQAPFFFYACKPRSRVAEGYTTFLFSWTTSLYTQAHDAITYVATTQAEGRSNEFHQPT